MKELTGKWVQGKGKLFSGSYSVFYMDSTFKAELASMSIFSSGSCKKEKCKIPLDQQEHTLDMIGTFDGIHPIEGNFLTMALSSGPGQHVQPCVTALEYITKEEG